MDIFETKYCCTLVSENAVRLFSESVALVFSVHNWWRSRVRARHKAVLSVHCWPICFYIMPWINGWSKPTQQ